MSVVPKKLLYGTKTPMKVFSTQGAAADYYNNYVDTYGVDPMEVLLYVTDSQDALEVYSFPTPDSFNPSFFTGENYLLDDYVPESPIDYTVSAVANYNTYGYVTGAGTYPEHSTATLNAYAYTGYTFNKWSNDVETSTYSFIVENNVDLTAIFEEDVPPTPTSNAKYMYIELPTMGDPYESGLYDLSLPNGLLFESGIEGTPYTQEIYVSNIGHENSTFTVAVKADFKYNNGTDDVYVPFEDRYNINSTTNEVTITSYITPEDTQVQLATHTYTIDEYNKEYYGETEAPDFGCGDNIVIIITDSIWFQDEAESYVGAPINYAEDTLMGFMGSDDITAVIPNAVLDEKSDNYDLNTTELYNWLMQKANPGLTAPNYVEAMCDFDIYYGIVDSEQDINSKNYPFDLQTKFNALEYIEYSLTNTNDKLPVESLYYDSVGGWNIIVPSNVTYGVSFTIPINFTDANNHVEDTATVTIFSETDGDTQFGWRISSTNNLFETYTHGWSNDTDYCTDEAYTAPLNLNGTEFLNVNLRVNGTLVSDIAELYNTSTSNIHMNQAVFVHDSDQVYFVKVTDETSEYYNKPYNITYDKITGTNDEFNSFYTYNKEIFNGGTHYVYYNGDTLLTLDATATFIS